MSVHLPQLQIEEAELLAQIIGDRLVRSAIDILKILGILENQSETDPDPDADPEEAKIISMAEALLRRHSKRR
ncbi:MAG: hypothetical protein V1912_03300 [bacterium]